MVKRFDWLLVYLLFSIGVMAQSGGKQYNSYKGLVMAGYQGWFNTPGDGSGRGWHHYNGRKCRSIRNSIRPNFPLLTANRLMCFLLMMNLP